MKTLNNFIKKMSKYKVHEVVKYTRSPGLYVVLMLEENIYVIMPKNKFDTWEPENIETYDSESMITNVKEEELIAIF